jgi:hypothetical protein
MIREEKQRSLFGAVYSVLRGYCPLWLLGNLQRMGTGKNVADIS